MGQRIGVVDFHLVSVTARAEPFVVMDGIAASDLLPMIASAESTHCSLIVSIHDVAPATWTACRHMVEQLAGLGIRRTSLLVVPDYHRRGKATTDTEFVRWLRDLETDGHEIVIHGYFHQRPRSSGEDLRDIFMTRVYTQSEGEFYDLSYDEAVGRISSARDEFRAAGLVPRGFIAPAWLLSKAGEVAARDAEMEYTTRLTEIKDLRTGERFHARSLVYSTSTSARRMASLLWNAALARTLATQPLVRLSVHPPDVRFAAIWKQIRAIASRFSRTHSATTYGEWVQEQRLVAGTEDR